jgi:hypothetical protein
MPYTLKDPVRHKFTKKSYNVRDWAKYDEGLKCELRANFNKIS